MEKSTRSAYAARANEYAVHLGSLEAVHAADRHLIETWADQVGGRILDAGCDPGHWTAHLDHRGCSVEGIDQVPEFIDHAQATYPGVAFVTGSIDKLILDIGSISGVLCCYSLIHHNPKTIHIALRELARVTAGSILVGFFIGSSVKAFDLAITTAYYWSISALTKELESMGFKVRETHARTGTGYRPHDAVMATRKS